MPRLRKQLRRAKAPPAHPGRLDELGGRPLTKRATSGTMASPKKVHTGQTNLPTLRMAHVAAGIAREMDLQQPMPRHDPPRRGVAPLLGARPLPSTRAPRTTKFPDHL